MKTRTAKFVAAAVIIMAVLIRMHYLGGSIDPASVAFAKATEALKKVSWIQTIESDREEWRSYDLQICINRDKNGNVVYTDYKEGKEYQYNPETNAIIIYSVSGSIEEKLLFWQDRLSFFLEQKAEIKSFKSNFKGKDVNIYLISLIINNNRQWQHEITVDVQTDLPVSSMYKILNQDGTVLTEDKYIFEYPQQGPVTIYEAGASETAKVFNYSSGDASKILEDSANNLRTLGTSIFMFGNDNEDMCPDTLQDLDSYLDNLQWFLDNIEYIAKGKSLIETRPFAYDKTILLQNGQMTNILFYDGSVKFTNIKNYIK